jgi:CheY-like chemotaxis protein
MPLASGAIERLADDLSSASTKVASIHYGETLEFRDSCARVCVVSSIATNRVYEPRMAVPTERKRPPRVLIVEDNSWLALAVAEEVTDLGWTVIGPAQNLTEALALARSQTLDAALLDWVLRDETSLAVAQILTKRGVPFTFTTGYDDRPGEPFENVPVLPKPFGSEAVKRTLIDMLGRSRTCHPY